MKIATVILFAAVCNVATASFFDSFQSTLFSISNSFGKMVSTVITDVRETIDCTILAMEQGLALGLFNGEEYEKRCRGVHQDSDIPAVTNNNTDGFNNNTNGLNNDTDALNNNTDGLKNNTDSKEFRNNEVPTNLETIKVALEDNTEHLKEINDLLKEELDAISGGIKAQKHEMQHEIMPSVDSVLKDLYTLEKEEKQVGDSKKVEKVDHVIEQILKILNITDSADQTLSKDKEKSVLESLEEVVGDTIKDFGTTIPKSNNQSENDKHPSIEPNNVGKDKKINEPDVHQQPVTVNNETRPATKNADKNNSVTEETLGDLQNNNKNLNDLKSNEILNDSDNINTDAHTDFQVENSEANNTNPSLQYQASNKYIPSNEIVPESSLISQKQPTESKQDQDEILRTDDSKSTQSEQPLDLEDSMKNTTNFMDGQSNQRNNDRDEMNQIATSTESGSESVPQSQHSKNLIPKDEIFPESSITQSQPTLKRNQDQETILHSDDLVIKNPEQNLNPEDSPESNANDKDDQSHQSNYDKDGIDQISTFTETRSQEIGPNLPKKEDPSSKEQIQDLDSANKIEDDTPLENEINKASNDSNDVQSQNKEPAKIPVKASDWRISNSNNVTSEKTSNNLVDPPSQSSNIGDNNNNVPSENTSNNLVDPPSQSSNIGDNNNNVPSENTSNNLVQPPSQLSNIANNNNNVQSENSSNNLVHPPSQSSNIANNNNNVPLENTSNNLANPSSELLNIGKNTYNVPPIKPPSQSTYLEKNTINVPSIDTSNNMAYSPSHTTNIAQDTNNIPSMNTPNNLAYPSSQIANIAKNTYNIPSENTHGTGNLPLNVAPSTNKVDIPQNTNSILPQSRQDNVMFKQSPAVNAQGKANTEYYGTTTSSEPYKQVEENTSNNVDLSLSSNENNSHNTTESAAPDAVTPQNNSSSLNKSRLETEHTKDDSKTTLEATENIYYPPDLPKDFNPIFRTLQNQADSIKEVFKDAAEIMEQQKETNKIMHDVYYNPKVPRRTLLDI